MPVNRPQTFMISPQARAAWRGVVGVLVASVLLLIGGCRSEQADGQQRHRAAQRTASKGPVEMTVVADRDQAHVAEAVHVTVNVRAEQGVNVMFPKVENTLGDFRVVDHTDTPDVPDGDHRLWRRMLQLESRTSGERTIPEMSVTFEDARKGDTPIHGEIKTDPIEVQVVSVLEGKADPRTFRDIKGAVELQPQPNHTWMYVAGGAGGAVLLAIAGVLLVVRYRRNRPLRAEVWALKQLDHLANENLIAAGEHQKYYYRLTDIVRAYIERRFSLRASRETTREFLGDIQNRSVLSDEHKEFLRAFLEQADIVKYACYQPGADETDSALDAARTFVTSSALQAKENDKKATRRAWRRTKEAVQV